MLETLEFREPMLLWFAVLAIPVYWIARRAPGRVIFSSLALIPKHARSWRERLQWIPDALLVIAVLALVIALAGPRSSERFSRVQRDGIAIMMVVDVSGSMRALDLSSDERERTRLEAVQDVFEAFVLGTGELAGRPDDAIGLISFAGYADSVVPLTLDHANLTGIARDLAIVSDRSEDGTAIGDGLGLAVERLRESPAESKIAVLLTDGVHNAGVESPAGAAELARSMGISVYTIGAGTTGLAPVRVNDPFTGRSVLRAVPVEVDEATLEDVAQRTGGRYFRATDADSLLEVYGEIDRLTRTQIVEERFRQYTELFSVPLAFGLLCALLAWIGRGTAFARQP